MVLAQAEGGMGEGGGRKGGRGKEGGVRGRKEGDEVLEMGEEQAR